MRPLHPTPPANGRLVPAHATTTPSGDHRTLDTRGLALGEMVAARLRADPRLLAVAERTLAHWRGRCAANVQPVLAEWQTILDAGLEATVTVLTGSGEREVRLRQSSPFAGEEIISRQQRRELWAAFTPVARINARGENRP